MATAVHRLAKLHSMHTSGAAALIVNSPQFRLLLGHIHRLLPYFEVRLLWSQSVDSRSIMDMRRRMSSAADAC